MKTFPFKLCLVTNRKLTKNLTSAVKSAIEGGVDAVQLREKDLTTKELFSIAAELRKLTREKKTKLFINDRVDIALASNADGVHLGGKSLPVSAVRKTASSLMIGVSCHSIKDVVEAEKKGTDYVFLGPIFFTQSKAQYGQPIGVESIKLAKKKVKIPIIAIGGINPDNVALVIKAGADGIAVISAILAEKNIKSAVGKLKTAIDITRLPRI